MSAPSFDGFPAETAGFLRELAGNNERRWFQENKHRYEDFVLSPAFAFIGAMAPRLEGISEHFLAIPKRAGGSLMRVYRDTRFSRNKTPYKTNIGIHFRHELGRDVHAPGFYVHIEPGSCFLGAGIWHPDAKALTAIRDRIVEDPGAWLRVRDARRFRGAFELDGASLKRPPRGVPADHPCIEDLKRKDFIATTAFGIADTQSPRFVEHAARCFSAAESFVGFLCGALSLRF